jgi:hypothetical protein
MFQELLIDHPYPVIPVSMLRIAPNAVHYLRSGAEHSTVSIYFRFAAPHCPR